MRSAGYVPIAFTTGAQAFNYLRSHPVDLIVLDSSLRNPDYLCRKLRQLTTVPLLFLLSPCELAILSSTITEDVDRFIFKPLVMAEVMSHIHALVRRTSWVQSQENFVSGDLVPYQEIRSFYPSM
jgi:DNA-binding response OmpR family regulator